MTNIKKSIISILITVGLIVGAFYIDQSLHRTSRLGDASNYNPIQAGTVTNTAVACGTTQTLLLATSSAGRPFLSISNNSAFSLYLSLGNTVSANTGIFVPASTTITFNQNSIYLGQIMCIATGGIATTTMSYVN